MLNIKIATWSLGMSTTLSFLLCVLYGLVTPQSLHMHQFLEIVLPAFTWLTVGGFFLGLIESFLWGAYMGLVFVPIYNFFYRRWHTPWPGTLLCDINGREAILRVHASKVQLAPEVDLRAIAAQTPGFAGADLANVINEAALLAARAGKAAVEMSDLREAIDRMVAGLEKKNRVINPQEKEVVAFHEAGHALVAAALPGTDRVSKISIIPRGIAALGYTQQQPTEDRYLLRKSELSNRLCVLLGGRVAEELVFGDVSTGAYDDLRKVSDMARAMVTTYGMSDDLGLLTYDQPTSPFLPGIVAAPPKTYSEETARKIDTEVKTIVDQAHEQVRQLLREQQPALEQLARRLLEHEVLEGAELQALLQVQSGTTVAAFSPQSPQGEV